MGFVLIWVPYCFGVFQGQVPENKCQGGPLHLAAQRS
ncbi:hypothetical protein MUK42_23973 [Musa troglodytarum]|uniref:Uncharacterized protein n=1 Tax=Musa troglodytarum TaxID=320322 RepID=A0A9E7G708_9LILI|nr:hypothetical protein MUK42_23973 [Musa troglodytarum]